MRAHAEGRYLLDADAFLCLRSLSLLRLLRDSDKMCEPLRMTEFIGRHELSSVVADVKDLQHRGRLEAVPSNDAEYKRLRKERVHKGEAEAIAWCLGQSKQDVPLFVSVDAGARAAALANRIPAGDILDIVVDLVGFTVLSREQANSALAVWSDHRQERGRPRDFTTFDDTFERRLRARRG